jgi:hypothetical protein
MIAPGRKNFFETPLAKNYRSCDVFNLYKIQRCKEGMTVERPSAEEASATNERAVGMNPPHA